MYDHRSVELDRIVFILDILFAVLTFLLSIYVRQLFAPEVQVDLLTHLLLVPLLLAFLIGFLSYFGAYQGPRYTTMTGYSWSICKGVTVSVTSLLALLFFLNVDYVSRMVILIFAGLELCVLLATRAAVKYYFIQAVKSGANCLRLLIIGTGDRAKEVAAEIQKQADWGVTIVGHLDPDPTRVGKMIEGMQVIGSVGDIHNCLKKDVVDEVIIAIPRSLLEDAEPIAHACEEEGIKLRFMVDIYDLQVARISLTQAGNIPLLTMEPVAQNANMLFLKRLFDLALIILALPLLVPVMLVTALAIKLDSPGPIMFVQQRVGLRKHLFPMFKFRSMYEDAEQRMQEIEHLNEAEGPIFKITNDPRVTRVGKFIRKTSLDELPQLFNVLLGEMSLVGPRPMSIRDVDLFDKGVQRKRFSVKPGITCIWQISGRSDLPFEKWLELDLEYIENWSFWLDVKILFKTIPAVLFAKGAK